MKGGTPLVPLYVLDYRREQEQVYSVIPCEGDSHQPSSEPEISLPRSQPNTGSRL